MQLLVIAKAFWSDEGQANATREVTKELVKLGVELLTVVHADSHAGYLGEPRTLISPISVDIKHNFLARVPPIVDYSLARRAARVLRSMQENIGPDCIVHDHGIHSSAYLDSEMKPKPFFVNTIHGTEEGELERFKREMPVHPRELVYRIAYTSSNYVKKDLCKRSKGSFIALSRKNACEIVRRGVSQSRVHIIPNGVDLNVFRPCDGTEARKQLGLPTDRPIVLTVSEIEPRKGLHTLIKAARDIAKEVPEAYFIIVGRIPSNRLWYMSCLWKLLREFHLSEHFRFAGFVPKKQLLLYLNAADVFTLPSFSEGAPLVIPEAMACSLITVATRSAEAGYLPSNLIVEDGDYKGLAQKISFYLLNAKERRLNGEELRKKAVKELSWGKIAKDTLEVYQETVLNGHA